MEMYPNEWTISSRPAVDPEGPAVNKRSIAHAPRFRTFMVFLRRRYDNTIARSAPMVPDQPARSGESPGLARAPARRKCRLESPAGLSEYDAGWWQCVLPCFFDSHKIDGTFEVTGVTMLGSCEVIAFVATAQPAKAKEFYENILGLRLVADEPFALV